MNLIVTKCEVLDSVGFILLLYIIIYRPFYGCEGMLGNLDKMVEKSKVCMRIQSHLILANRPFYRYGGHIEFITFKEYYGIPRGRSLSIYGAFRAKRELHCVFLGKKAIILTSKHGTTIFFPITIPFF